MSNDVTERFSDRVAEYVRHRPTYPSAVIDLLATRCGLRPQAAVADVGSGTGILTALLLQTGCRVFAVEPNDAMRAAAEAALGGSDRFTSVAGRAEATGLASGSVDLITVAQAYHWFDAEGFAAEVARVLRPGGSVALIWNERRKDGSPFDREYEQLLRTHGTDYEHVRRRYMTDERLDLPFADGRYETTRFQNAQSFDFEGLTGRLLSSSYTPAPGTAGRAAIVAALRPIFDRHAVAGRVSMQYDVVVYHGRGRGK